MILDSFQREKLHFTFLLKLDRPAMGIPFALGRVFMKVGMCIHGRHAIHVLRVQVQLNSRWFTNLGPLSLPELLQGLAHTCLLHLPNQLLVVV